MKALIPDVGYLMQSRTEENSMVSLIRHPVSFLGARLLGIWRDEPSWAEFTSSMAFLIYAAFLWLGKGPEEWASLDLITQLLPGWGWAILTACGGMVQLFALILRVRFLRAAAAMGGLLWIGGMVALVWPIYPFSPLLGMAATWALPNLMVVARHARDW